MSQGERFMKGGKPLRCHQCGHDRFSAGSALLNTGGLTLLGLDFLNRSARFFACDACGYLHWFVEPSPDAPIGDTTACLACGEAIRPNETACPKCGWTYREAKGETPPFV